MSVFIGLGLPPYFVCAVLQLRHTLLFGLSTDTSVPLCNKTFCILSLLRIRIIQVVAPVFCRG